MNLFAGARQASDPCSSSSVPPPTPDGGRRGLLEIWDVRGTVLHTIPLGNDVATVRIFDDAESIRVAIYDGKGTGHPTAVYVLNNSGESSAVVHSYELDDGWVSVSWLHSDGLKVEVTGSMFRFAHQLRCLTDRSDWLTLEFDSEPPTSTGEAPLGVVSVNGATVPPMEISTSVPYSTASAPAE